MATAQLHPIAANPAADDASRAQQVGEFLTFLLDLRTRLNSEAVSATAAEVQLIRDPIEEHYVDDQGKPAMYMQFESALYDDAPVMTTLWRCFQSYQPSDLRIYRRLTALELDGLTGDRHPRKIFDRSPFGVAALIAGTLAIWMSVLKTFSGEDLSELLELIRFNWSVGTIWIVGLFVAVWYILKTHRNNRQTAFLSSVARALDLYLQDPQKPRRRRG
jgi:hypothetical protein